MNYTHNVEVLAINTRIEHFFHFEQKITISSYDEHNSIKGKKLNKSYILKSIRYLNLD